MPELNILFDYSSTTNISSSSFSKATSLLLLSEEGTEIENQWGILDFFFYFIQHAKWNIISCKLYK